MAITGKALVPVPPPNVRRLSTEFERLCELCSGKSISLHDLLDSVTSRSHALPVLLLAMPFILPIPLPGFSVIFGMIIAVLGAAMVFGRKPWLPKSWLDRKVPSAPLLKAFHFGVKLSRWVEVAVRPRGEFIVRFSWIRQLTGLMIALCGVMLALPLPPGTNSPPALAIILLAVATLEEDALFLALGILGFLLNVAFFGTLLIFGAQGVSALFDRFL